VDRYRDLEVFQLGPPVRLLTKKPKSFLRSFDADGRGLFLSPTHSLEWSPALCYLSDDGRQTEVLRPDFGTDNYGAPVSADGSEMAFVSQTETWNIGILEHAF
jgi:hypothetical protein